MTTPAYEALLNQILTTLNAFGERLAVVESDLKTVIRDHTKDLDDHEVRLRRLEADSRLVATKAELDALEVRRAAEINAALEASDKRANRRIGWAGLALAVVTVGVNVAIALLR